MLFFVSNGCFKKKTMGTRWARRPGHKKKLHGHLKKKNMGSVPFFESPFFRAHDPGIPRSIIETKIRKKILKTFCLKSPTFGCIFSSKG